MKFSGESSNRDFQEWRTHRFGTILKKNNTVLCLLCRTSSVKRHFQTIHETVSTKSLDEQKSLTYIIYYKVIKVIR